MAFLRVPVAGEGPYVKAIEDAARALGLALQLVEVREPADLPGAFAAIRRERADGLFVWAQPLTHAHRKEIVDFAATSRLPAAYGSRPFADAGGLLFYGVDYRTSTSSSRAPGPRTCPSSSPRSSRSSSTWGPRRRSA